jgi:hypothetical protein
VASAASAERDVPAESAALAVPVDPASPAVSAALAVSVALAALVASAASVASVESVALAALVVSAGSAALVALAELAAEFSARARAPEIGATSTPAISTPATSTPEISTSTIIGAAIGMGGAITRLAPASLSAQWLGGRRRRSDRPIMRCQEAARLTPITATITTTAAVPIISRNMKVTRSFT